MKVKVGEITKIKTGKLDANASSADGKYPFFTCSKDPLRINSYSYDCECVLVAGNGDLNVKYYNGKFDAYQRTYIIEDNSNGLLYMPYLYHFLEGYIGELRKQSIGGVIKYIKLGNLTDVLVELPSIVEQKYIVNLMNISLELIELRKKTIDKLDSLVKARFIEMFGDPYTNPLKWEKLKIKDAVTVEPQNGLYKPQSDYVTDRSGIPILRIDGFYDGIVTDFASLKRLKCSETEKQKYLLLEDDIVINRVNSIEYLGKCAHIKGLLEDTVYESNMMRMHFDPETYNSVYICKLLCSQFIYDQIVNHAKKAVNQASINQKDVLDFNIYQPPIDLQNQFADFIQQVESLLEQEEVTPVKVVPDVDLEALIAENKSLKEELSSRRVQQQETYVSKPLDLSEFKTRKLYIDAMLMDAGWIEGKDWINEVELDGMPNKSEVGYADYVLYDDMNIPLAVIEAKRSCKDPAVGRQQAKLYADLLEKKYKRRPVIFITNGFETRIIDNDYPERRVSSIYSKRDLEKYFNLRRTKSHLNYIAINKNIAGRYYQEAAVRAVCEAFDKGNRRKALLVMATGSGKTRTVISLVDVLLNNGWIKNILFLADRNSLVTQAKRSFVNLLPDLSATNLVEDKENYNAHAVFSTYQTMIGCIDTIKDEGKKLFTCGHFDLIICDEAHRSIYNKYRDIFSYFDAPLVGLTATPKDEIDKNTYEVFELENGIPTYGYELAQAVKDEFLVDYKSIECSTEFMKNGIHWDELDNDEKEEYEETFVDEEGNVPEVISASAINQYVFNKDTVRKVLATLFKYGIRIDYGQKIGKTIIFAKNHKHAEFILEIFNKDYPELKGYAEVIDNKINYSQTLIDQFSDPKKLPQIAISVDMLDTGIDVPECVNLIFFKKVMSKAKFWQMIGRGTRLCPGLLDGKDKDKFLIFDFCGNFEFFRMKTGSATPNMLAVQGAVFALKFEIAYKLQALNYQTDELKKWRKELVDYMVSKVKELDRNRFDVRQHLKYVDLYSNPDHYQMLTYEDCLMVRQELAPLILPDEDEVSAVRFDALMYGIELAHLAEKQSKRRIKDLLKKVTGLSKVSNIPAIEKESEIIHAILNTNYLEYSGIDEFENIRLRLRDLIKYIPRQGLSYETNFEDDILDVQFNDSELENDDLKNYKSKIEYYIRQHQKDNPVILKIKENKPLSSTDLVSLENILWKELGSKKDYYSEVGEKPICEFVREIVGLDMNAAKDAFSKYLDERNLNSEQIYFVNQIVEYIVRNGLMKDMSVLQQSPFTDKGSVADLFGNDIQTWMEIKSVIDNINNNANYN